MTANQLLVVVAACAAGAMVKSITGMGYPVIAVPIITLVAGVETAVIVVALPNLAANLYMCWETRETRSGTRDLPRLVAWGSLGAVIGTIALVKLPEAPLMVILAITIVLFIVQFVRHPQLRLDEATTRRWSPLAGFTAGCMQGSIGVSGPVVATWMHGYRLAPRTYIHSVTLIFAITGFVQIVILFAQNRMSSERLVAMACAAATVTVVIPLGVRFRNRLAGDTFDRLVLGAILLSAVALLLQVVF